MSEKRILRKCKKNCKASSHSHTLKMRLKKLYRKLKKAFKNGATQIKRRLNNARTPLLAKASQILSPLQRQLTLLIVNTFKTLQTTFPSHQQLISVIVVNSFKVLMLYILVSKAEPILEEFFHLPNDPNSILKELIILTLLQKLKILE